MGLREAIRRWWPLISNKVSFVVGNGRNVKSLSDVWWDEVLPSISFPSLFDIAEVRDAWVRDYWSRSQEEVGWQPLFTRHFNDWEVEDLERLLARLGKITLVDELEDTLRWTLSSTGLFSVKSLYKALKLKSSNIILHYIEVLARSTN